MDDQYVINCLKGLVIDGVHKAQSGHPGGAMSSMDFAYILFTEYLNFDPDDPKWLGRDRFILSAGHESMLQYAFLYAIGWLTLKDLQEFRQLHSKTPGHPENILTPGVECTTGPLGQGVAMSVGFALAAAHLAATLGEKRLHNRTWVILGDGCMQEGITYASASLAGHWQLGHLIWYYDKNQQQISGPIKRSTSDDEKKIFEGLGWHVIEIDGHHHQEIRSAINKALAITNKPSLIIGHTTMAKGAASLEGSHETHGAPLPEAERIATKKKLDLPIDQDFFWPEVAAKHFQRRFADLKALSHEWRRQIRKRKDSDAVFAEKCEHYFGEFAPKSLSPISWDLRKPMATRNAFGQILETWSDELPKLIGGSADLEPSNMTGAFAKKVGDFSKDHRAGRNLSFGVREFPMSAISNGIALYGGFIPFDATFLSFADYSRPALRLGAIQKCRVIHEFTHDSFYLGEDGPTHQPVEHIMSLRAMPGMYVMRPADPRETEVLMRVALSLSAPTSLCLTRQKVPYLPVDDAKVKEAARGAWVVAGNEDKVCDLVIFATGSELHLGLEARKQLMASKQLARIKVVSVPCWELFFSQEEAYIHDILSLDCQRRVSIEAGATLGWEKLIGMQGLAIGIDHFGDSAPAEHLAKIYGFTVEDVCKKIEKFFKL